LESHNLMFWMCAIFLHLEKKKDLKKTREAVQKLEEEKAMHFLMLEQYQEEVNELEETRSKYHSKINYLKDTVSKVRRLPLNNL
jgi:hypothetical protein